MGSTIINFIIMAKNNSFIRIEGTLDGLTFYRKNGESLIKTKNRLSRNRIMNDPAYKRTRENMREFGGSAICGKSFRESFAGIVRLVADAFISSRVTGLMRTVIASGAGLRGERAISLVDHLETFVGFNFNVKKPFDSHFNAPAPAPVLNANRDTLTWNVPDFNTDTYVLRPEGATHFKLALAAGFVSNYEWDPASKTYVPVEVSPNGIGGVVYSAPIALGGMVGAAIDLEVDLSALGPVPVTTAVFGGIAIVFYQMVNGELYELAQGHCMKIAVGG